MPARLRALAARGWARTVPVSAAGSFGHVRAGMSRWACPPGQPERNGPRLAAQGLGSTGAAAGSGFGAAGATVAAALRLRRGSHTALGRSGIRPPNSEK